MEDTSGGGNVDARKELFSKTNSSDTVRHRYGRSLGGPIIDISYLPPHVYLTMIGRDAKGWGEVILQSLINHPSWVRLPALQR